MLQVPHLPDALQKTLLATYSDNQALTHVHIHKTRSSNSVER